MRFVVFADAQFGARHALVVQRPPLLLVPVKAADLFADAVAQFTEGAVRVGGFDQRLEWRSVLRPVVEHLVDLIQPGGAAIVGFVVRPPHPQLVRTEVLDHRHRVQLDVIGIGIVLRLPVFSKRHGPHVTLSWGRKVALLHPALFRGGRSGGRGQRLPTGEGVEHRFEPIGQLRQFGAFGQPVEPREMRQQQAAVIAAASGHLLPMIEHRLLHAIQRAVGQHLFGMRTGGEQRHIPRPRKFAAGPPRAIGALMADPHPPGSPPRRSAIGQRPEKLRLPLPRKARLRRTGFVTGQSSDQRGKIGRSRSRLRTPARAIIGAIVGRIGVRDGHGPVLRMGKWTGYLWGKGGCRKGGQD
ncbi:hypothetical protein D6858_02775 [Tsuneonella suprasediminis]|uniref:Uncharacterized protein n=1 Tax=Tsuneonella suprasediminis TaxID=2306996 RepID=A0A419R523_9SPHN|nr:hypothetical protein D6858_02775 [Tsuneonella suprasediminis]